VATASCSCCRTKADGWDGNASRCIIEDPNDVEAETGATVQEKRGFI